MRPGRLKVLVSALGGFATIAGISAGLVLSSSPGRAAPVRDVDADGKAPTVGALFVRTPAGQLTVHFCTGSVVDSPAGDLVITAAHCLIGRTASHVAFVPGYARGKRPYGVWVASKIIEDPAWTPDDDYAFLVVHQPGSNVAVQSLTGGEKLGIGAQATRSVQVAGYPDDLDWPISCENRALDFSATQFEFDCGGFTDGTSGSPLLADDAADNVQTVIGVIGGYEQGGLTASVSYAARFSARMAALYQNALAAG